VSDPVRARLTWPAVGLAVLGVWLGIAYDKTQGLWLPMGLHSGGILAIGVHRRPRDLVALVRRPAN